MPPLDGQPPSGSSTDIPEITWLLKGNFFRHYLCIQCVCGRETLISQHALLEGLRRDYPITDLAVRLRCRERRVAENADLGHRGRDASMSDDPVLVRVSRHL